MSVDMAVGGSMGHCQGLHVSWKTSVLFRFGFVLLLFYFYFFLAGHAQPEAGGNAIKIKTYF